MKAVIFDMDGLLVDTEELSFIAWDKLFERYGVKLNSEEEYIDFVGVSDVMTAQEIYRRLKASGKLPEAFTNITPDEMRNLKYEIFDRLIPTIKVMEGAHDFVEALRTRVKIAVASQSRVEYIKRILGPTGLLDKFAMITGGDEVRNPKPAPDIYHLAVHRLGLKPEECVAFEDSLSGINSAKNAGLRCIAIPNKYSIRQDLSRADAVISSFRALDAEDFLKNF